MNEKPAKFLLDLCNWKISKSVEWKSNLISFFTDMDLCPTSRPKLVHKARALEQTIGPSRIEPLITYLVLTKTNSQPSSSILGQLPSSSRSSISTGLRAIQGFLKVFFFRCCCYCFYVDFNHWRPRIPWESEHRWNLGSSTIYQALWDLDTTLWLFPLYSSVQK